MKKDNGVFVQPPNRFSRSCSFSSWITRACVVEHEDMTIYPVLENLIISHKGTVVTDDLHICNCNTL
jgi:hypothetical protein